MVFSRKWEHFDPEVIGHLSTPSERSMLSYLMHVLVLKLGHPKLKFCPLNSRHLVSLSVTMTDIERDQIDSDAQEFIQKLSEEVGNLRKDGK